MLINIFFEIIFLITLLPAFNIVLLIMTRRIKDRGFNSKLLLILFVIEIVCLISLLIKPLGKGMFVVQYFIYGLVGIITLILQIKYLCKDMKFSRKNRIMVLSHIVVILIVSSMNMFIQRDMLSIPIVNFVATLIFIAMNIGYIYLHRSDGTMMLYYSSVWGVIFVASIIDILASNNIISSHMISSLKGLYFISSEEIVRIVLVSAVAFVFLCVSYIMNRRNQY